jgi:6-phosphogluconate dehydrogenase
MQLGMIGLGRMGANMVRRLMKNGHEGVVFDRSPATVAQLVSDGAKGSGSLDEFVKKLKPPRAVWLMVPAGVVDATLADLTPNGEGRHHHRRRQFVLHR